MSATYSGIFKLGTIHTIEQIKRNINFYTVLNAPKKTLEIATLVYAIQFKLSSNKKEQLWGYVFYINTYKDTYILKFGEL